MALNRDELKLMIKITKAFEVELEGVLCVDADGNFLGEYFPRQQVEVEHRPAPAGATQLPAGTPPPPHHRCTWNGTGWNDPGPDPKEVERQQQRAEADAARKAALVKLEKLGLTAEDVRSVLGE